jgi:replicative DNA helicase
MFRFETDVGTRAERYVLASLLRDASAWSLCATLHPRAFSHEAHGEMYRTIRALIERDEPVTFLTVYHAMLTRRASRALADLEYLHTLASASVEPKHCGFYADMLRAPVHTP